MWFILCVAFNVKVCAITTINFIFFTVLFFAVKPRIIAHSKNLNLYQETSYMINCTASGYPLPSFSWVIPGQANALPSSNTTSGTNITATYQIKNVSIENVQRLLKTLFISYFNFINDYIVP